MEKTTAGELFCLPCDMQSGKQPVPLDLRFEFVVGNVTRVPDGHSTGWRTMPFHLCCFSPDIPRGGCGMVYCKGRDPVRQEKNSVLFIPAGLTHKIDGEGAGGPGTSVWIHFRTAFLHEFEVFSFFGADMLLLKGDASRRVRELLRSIIACPPVLNTAESLWLQMYGVALTLELLKHAGIDPAGETPEISLGKRRLLPALSMLNQAHVKPGVPELASAVHLSASRFLAVFKKEMGLTPGRYFQQVVFGRACKLLADSSRSIAECADL